MKMTASKIAVISGIFAGAFAHAMRKEYEKEINSLEGTKFRYFADPAKAFESAMSHVSAFAEGEKKYLEAWRECAQTELYTQIMGADYE